MVPMTQEPLIGMTYNLFFAFPKTFELALTLVLKRKIVTNVSVKAINSEKKPFLPIKYLPLFHILGDHMKIVTYSQF